MAARLGVDDTEEEDGGALGDFVGERKEECEH